MKIRNSFITTISNPQTMRHFVQSVTPVIMAHASNKLLINTDSHSSIFFFSAVWLVFLVMRIIEDSFLFSGSAANGGTWYYNYYSNRQPGPQYM